MEKDIVNVTELEEINDVKPITESQEINIQETNFTRYKEEFSLLFIGNLDFLVNEIGLTQNEMKVLSRVLKLLTFGNLININQALIGKDLNLHKSNVSRAFKSLTDKEVFINIESGLFINPKLIFKGNLKKMKDGEVQNITHLMRDGTGTYNAVLS